MLFHNQGRGRPVGGGALSNIVYDTFTRANGILGNTEGVGPEGQAIVIRPWTSATYAIDTNEAKNTPTEVGGELVTNGGMEGVYVGAGTLFYAPNWGNSGMDGGVDTASEELVIVHGGAKSQKIDVDASVEGIVSAANVLPSQHLWYTLSAWIYRTGGVSTRIHSENNGIRYTEVTTLNTWVKMIATGRPVFANRKVLIRSDGGATAFFVDDVSAAQLTLSTLFASLETSTADVVIDVDIAIDPDATQAGIVMNLDDAVTPANFVIAYLGQAASGVRQAKLEKNVAGTYTTVIAANVTFAADATLRVVKDRNDYSLFYDDVQVGATQVINDAGIVDNKIHGLFSTYVDNRLDNFTVIPG